jgi:hypothetical protein
MVFFRYSNITQSIWRLGYRLEDRGVELRFSLTESNFSISPYRTDWSCVPNSLLYITGIEDYFLGAEWVGA